MCPNEYDWFYLLCKIHTFFRIYPQWNKRNHIEMMKICTIKIKYRNPLHDLTIQHLNVGFFFAQNIQQKNCIIIVVECYGSLNDTQKKILYTKSAIFLMHTNKLTSRKIRKPETSRNLVRNLFDSKKKHFHGRFLVRNSLLGINYDVVNASTKTK